jgi:hypothetical protein
MMTWTPNEWGTAASEVFGAFYFAKFLYGMVLSMFGAENAPHTINITVTQEHPKP